MIFWVFSLFLNLDILNKTHVRILHWPQELLIPAILNFLYFFPSSYVVYLRALSSMKSVWFLFE